MTNEKDTIMMHIPCCIRARDKGINQLRKEYKNFKGKLLPEIRRSLRPVIKNPKIKVYAQQKWAVDQKIFQYVKNLPLHPMPFHNQSVWIEQTEQGYFRIHFKNKQLPTGEDIVCNLVVPKRYRSLLAKACGKNNATLRQTELIEDNQYARFNVHITLRLPKPKPYTPKGWIGVDVGYNYLAVSALVTDKKISDVAFHGKHFKTRIIQLKYLWKQHRRANRNWQRWNHRLKYTIKYAVGKVAKEIVEKAKKYRAGVAFEDLSFPSHTKRFLIPRYKLKCAIENLCERKGIPFKLVNPRNTSITCNRCGYVSKHSRNGKVFKCQQCGYESNADFNAAVNVANRAILS